MQEKLNDKIRQRCYALNFKIVRIIEKWRFFMCSKKEKIEYYNMITKILQILQLYYNFIKVLKVNRCNGKIKVY